MNMANIYEEKVLNTFRNITATAPSKMYAGLLIELPTGTNLGTEVSYTGYQRQQVTFSAPAENVSLYGSGKIGISNTNELKWAVLPNAAGTALGVGYWDAVTGGNMYAYATIADGLTLDANEQPFIPTSKSLLISDGNFTKTFSIEMLNILRGVSISGFQTYIGLSNGDPTDGGTELVGDNYSRKNVVYSAPAQQTNEQALVSNTNEIVFNVPNSDWGLWTHNIYSNAESAGNIVMVSQLVSSTGTATSKEIKIGRTPRANVGSLKLGVN